MQENEGAKTPDDIAAVFCAAGLNSHFIPLASIDMVEEKVGELSGGQEKRGGLAFTRNNGPGHMVVVVYNPVTQELDYLDYQISPTGADARNDVKNGASFFYFPC